MSGIPELVSDGDNGLLVAPEDPAALADALRRLALDDELRRRLAAAGRRTVADRFDGDVLAASWPPCCRCRHDRRRHAHPQRVVCVVDDAGRDLAVADAAAAGRFTHNGVTLDLGEEPDWIRGGLAHDVEWRIEWVKTTRASTSPTPSRSPATAPTWRRGSGSSVVRHQVPVGFERSEVSARRMQNWLYAWQRFRDVGGADIGRRAAGRPARRPTPTTSAAHLTPERNHRTLELYALLLVGLALDDRRAGSPGSRRPGGQRRDRHPPRRRPPGALERLPPDRAALARRRRRQRPGRRPRRPARPPRRACSWRATSRCTCNDRTA